MKYVFCLTFFSILSSCLYKAGNRRSDLNFGLELRVNSYYVDSYLRETYMRTSYPPPLNSELVNYPNDFIPLKDTINNLLYVLELRVSGDSTNNNGTGISLTSIYHFEKQQWVIRRDSVSDSIMDKFQAFFKNEILEPTVKRFTPIVTDSVLFIDKTKMYNINFF